MTDTQTRRDVLVVTALAGAAAALPAQAAGPAATGHEHDWDWLVGRWSVRHRRLRGRLVGSKEWETFGGSSVHWTTMGGLGNTDDNVIEAPTGAYRAMSLRAYDPKMDRWGIWWLDSRYPDRVEPPVFGGFRDGVGQFEGDDMLREKPIRVRFVWSRITPASARWEQAFSPDGGRTWETNWEMDFTRVAR